MTSGIFFPSLIPFVFSRLPAYLTRSPHFIFQGLAQQFNCSLNKQHDQIFIHRRLQLLDRQYRLDIDRTLWRSYLNLTSQDTKFLPVRFSFNHQQESLA